MNLAMHDYTQNKLLCLGFFCINDNIKFLGYQYGLSLVASHPNPIRRKTRLIIESYHMKLSESK